MDFIKKNTDWCRWILVFWQLKEKKKQATKDVCVYASWFLFFLLSLRRVFIMHNHNKYSSRLVPLLCNRYQPLSIFSFFFIDCTFLSFVDLSPSLFFFFLILADFHHMLLFSGPSKNYFCSVGFFNLPLSTIRINQEEKKRVFLLWTYVHENRIRIVSRHKQWKRTTYSSFISSFFSTRTYE